VIWGERSEAFAPDVVQLTVDSQCGDALRHHTVPPAVLWLNTYRTGVSRHTGLMSQDIGDRSWTLEHVEGPVGDHRDHGGEAVCWRGGRRVRRGPVVAVRVLARHRAEGEAVFEPRSRRPKTSPSPAGWRAVRVWGLHWCTRRESPTPGPAIEVLVVIGGDAEFASRSAIEPASAEERARECCGQGAGEVGMTFGRIEARSSEDAPAGPQVIEIDVQVGNQSFSPWGQPVVPVVAGLQRPRLRSAACVARRHDGQRGGHSRCELQPWRRRHGAGATSWSAPAEPLGRGLRGSRHLWALEFVVSVPTLRSDADKATVNEPSEVRSRRCRRHASSLCEVPGRQRFDRQTAQLASLYAPGLPYTTLLDATAAAAATSTSPGCPFTDPG